MNERQLTSCAALMVALATATFGQSPPANDNFANRIVLTGSSITFTGTVAGSTVEELETPPFRGYYPPPGGGSVWWSWTTPVTTRVVIEIPHGSITNAELEVYIGTALNALTFVDENYFSEPPGRYISFLAYPTNTYQIRVAGIGPEPFSLRLTATNPPIFIFQPKDCVVSPFGSAFFGAMATGPNIFNIYPPPPSPTSYQWTFNGVPIPGQTSPSLVVHSVTTNQVGSYSVIASNIGGVTQGGSATLSVIDTNPVPQIAALQPTNSSAALLALAGEPGRWYKIESTPSFPFLSFPPQLGVHLQPTNTSQIVSLSRFTPAQFVRASLDVDTDVCVARLKQWWWGLKVYAIEGRRAPNDTYMFSFLLPYVPLTSRGNIPLCPTGGSYISGGPITNPPTCSLSSVGHKPTDWP